jgi:hypothetical protein
MEAGMATRTRREVRSLDDTWNDSTALWMLSERYSGRRPFDLFAWVQACRSLVRNGQISRA